MTGMCLECGAVAMQSQYPEDKKWGLIFPVLPAHKLVLDILRITRKTPCLQSSLSHTNQYSKMSHL